LSRLGADPPRRSPLMGGYGWRSLSRSCPFSDVLRHSRGTTIIGSDADGSFSRFYPGHRVQPTRADTHGDEPRGPSPHVRWWFRPFARMNRTSPSYRSGALARPRHRLQLRVTAFELRCAHPFTTLPSGGELLHSNPSRPRWDHEARACLHEEPSSWSRRRGCCHPRPRR